MARSSFQSAASRAIAVRIPLVDLIVHVADARDGVVQDVGRTLYETVSSFNGNIRCEVEMEALIDRQFSALQEAFHVPAECEDADVKVAGKLLNLFRTGRLGHYILDNLPTNIR